MPLPPTSENGHPELRVDRRPDEKDGESADIDAVAGQFAIEHTSVDTLPNQRRDSDWFMRAAGNLEQELEAPPSFRLNITLEYYAASTSQNWAGIREALKAWIRDAAPSPVPTARPQVQRVSSGRLLRMRPESRGLWRSLRG